MKPGPLVVLTAAVAQFALVALDRADKDSPKSKTAPEGPFASNALVAGAGFGTFRRRVNIR
jgi:hypothetical protein